MTDDSTLLGDALNQYYQRQGLPPAGGEHEPFFVVQIGPLKFKLPNPPARKRAIFFHDTNHILAGYNNVFSQGEMEIAGFEIGAGCGPFAAAWVINLGVWALGMFVCPGPMFAAFVRGRRTSSIYERTEDRATLSAMRVGTLREMAKVNVGDTVPRIDDFVKFAGWSIVAVVTLLGPFAIAVWAAWSLAVFVR